MDELLRRKEISHTGTDIADEEQKKLENGATWGSAPNSPRAFAEFSAARIQSLYEGTGPAPSINSLYLLDEIDVPVALDAAEDKEPVEWGFLKHSTISRDQTGKSSHLREQLLALIVGAAWASSLSTAAPPTSSALKAGHEGIQAPKAKSIQEPEAIEPTPLRHKILQHPLDERSVLYKLRGSDTEESDKSTPKSETRRFETVYIIPNEADLTSPILGGIEDRIPQKYPNGSHRALTFASKSTRRYDRESTRGRHPPPSPPDSVSSIGSGSGKAWATTVERRRIVRATRSVTVTLPFTGNTETSRSNESSDENISSTETTVNDRDSISEYDSSIHNYTSEGEGYSISEDNSSTRSESDSFQYSYSIRDPSPRRMPSPPPRRPRRERRDPGAISDDDIRVARPQISYTISPRPPKISYHSDDADSHNENDSVQELRRRLDALELENRILKGENGATKLPEKSTAPTWVTIYRLDGNSYLAEPQSVRDGEGRIRMIGNLPLRHMEKYVERHPGLLFVLFKDYRSKRDYDQESPEALEEETLRAPEPDEESLRFISSDMVDALKNFTHNVPGFGKFFPKFSLEHEIPAPFLFYYHCLPMMHKALLNLSDFHQEIMGLLHNCIEQSRGAEYREAINDFEKGVVSKRTMPYLIKPDDVLVCWKTSTLLAYIALGWAEERGSGGHRPPKPTSRRERDRDVVLDFDDWGMEGRSSEKKKVTSWWEVRCWSWEFDGCFQKREKLQTIYIEAMDENEKFEISSLNLYPIRYATNAKDTLLKRGRMFWKCRNRKFVSYETEDEDHGGLNVTSERFMIDNSTYKRLHTETSTSKKSLKDDLGPVIMARDDPPDDDTLLLYPPTITGYNMRLKKWVDLRVDRISEVTWNTKAFESLVLDDESKELVQALVTNQIAAEKSTDLIHGKGNGLIILLHGGPGTGKTFTAESVAEIANKPLYRVTCGDIGTEPEGVEKYLESVLHLGKIWGCVVLLDEADVFLEERSLEDLQRNALVSVFLRVLEYYDGILILTSNRVGTFDEAFKSRIQLALHYENLTKTQRRKIWRNFMNRLKLLGEPGIDYEEIDDHIDDLAEGEMNGRQIRNAITTGRQLAQYKKKDFNYAHLKHVINVASKFDKYLKKVKEGLSDDQLARDGGLR